jgi:hypothetical protein
MYLFFMLLIALLLFIEMVVDKMLKSINNNGWYSAQGLQPWIMKILL